MSFFKTSINDADTKTLDDIVKSEDGVPLIYPADLQDRSRWAVKLTIYENKLNETFKKLIEGNASDVKSAGKDIAGSIDKNVFKKIGNVVKDKVNELLDANAFYRGILDKTQTPTNKPVATIYLPVTQSFTHNSSANYGTSAGDYNTVINGGIETALKVLGLATNTRKTIGNVAAQTFDNKTLGIFGIQKGGAGTATSRIYFEGLSHNKHNLTIELLPDNEEEAETIHKIIKAISEYSTPKKVKGQAALFHMPYIFKIEVIAQEPKDNTAIIDKAFDKIAETAEGLVKEAYTAIFGDKKNKDIKDFLSKDLKKGEHVRIQECLLCYCTNFSIEHGTGSGIFYKDGVANLTRLEIELTEIIARDHDMVKNTVNKHLY